MLLKATRPDDQRPLPEFIGAILDATATFHRDEDVASNGNPYRVTLRKLWAKMAEKDWRTAAKALYIFHVLLRSVACLGVVDDARCGGWLILDVCVGGGGWGWLMLDVGGKGKGKAPHPSLVHPPPPPPTRHRRTITSYLDSRECEPDDVRIYKKVYAKMCREGCKKTKCRYFDTGAINDVAGEAQDADPFE